MIFSKFEKNEITFLEFLQQKIAPFPFFVVSMYFIPNLKSINQTKEMSMVLIAIFSKFGQIFMFFFEVGIIFCE